DADGSPCRMPRPCALPPFRSDAAGVPRNAARFQPLAPAGGLRQTGGMAKPVTTFTCTACGASHPNWSGRGDACGAWHTITEEAPLSQGPAGRGLGAAKGQLVALTGLDAAEAPPPRRESGLAELDRVLGGGLVEGSAILVGGDPGIGKSTLLLQAAAAFSR